MFVQPALMQYKRNIHMNIQSIFWCISIHLITSRWFNIHNLFFIFNGEFYVLIIMEFNLHPATLLNWNFHPLNVVSRYRNPQLQVCDSLFV